jgi:hypothetical protein
VEAPITDQISNLGADSVKYDIFPCRKIGNMEIAKFSDINSEN